MTGSVALGLLAAATFAVAAAAQHRVTRSLARSQPIRVVVPALLRHPLWLAGFAGNVLGFVLHMCALRIGDLGVIQAVLVLQLLFALPLARSERPAVREWVGTAAVCASLAIMIVGPFGPDADGGSERSTAGRRGRRRDDGGAGWAGHSDAG